MADSYTSNLNLRKPEVGAAFDTWGGTAGLNADLDLLDAVFLATGLGTSVGLHVGVGKVANIEGTVLFADSTDTTKVMTLDSSLITTGTLRTLQAPDESGIIATRNFVQTRLPTGAVISGYFGTTPPPGFVMADGRTIGDTTSGATNRANADCQVLFILLWSITTNTQCPVSGGRGASAAADFAAHKTLALPNHSGRTMAGRDDLSGSAAGVWSGATVLAVAGGEQTHTLSAAEMPSHNHSASVSAGSLIISSPSVNFAGSGPFNISNPTVTIGYAGGDQAHNNIQPTIVVDVIIAL